MEEVEEDIMSQSLLERAGLERPKQHQEEKRPPVSSDIDPGDILLADDQ
jgi:hypothetical protein